MDRVQELELLERRLGEIRRECNRLFVSQVELRINIELLAERQRDIYQDRVAADRRYYDRRPDGQ